MRVQTLWLPRAGHAEAEYEDAFAVAAVPGGLRVAVADGATETAFAKPWAQALAEAFVGVDDAAAWAPRARAAFAAGVAPRLAGLPWFAAAKAEEGAFAALLGVAIAADGTWQAWAVGDCCLLHWRAGVLCGSWPFTTPDAFTHRPLLLGSRPGDAPPWRHRSGTWLPGDVLGLATDALAAWLLAARPPAPPADAFHRHVEAARAARTLRNDDVTLVLVEPSRTAV